MEEIIMKIILHAGDARSKCFMALKAARTNRFGDAQVLMKEANEAILAAHKVQTDMIQKEAKGDRQEVSLLMVHAQDHLMTALAIRDLTQEFIAYMKDQIQIREDTAV